MIKIMWYIQKHKVLTFLVVVLIVIAALRIRSGVVAKQSAEADLLTYDVMSYEEYMETLKDVPSDIEGMSQYDKYQAGLNYRDGSDSDYDGLTDKEEIEIYGTDPLEASTSGDLYTDGYKVQNGMDVTQCYEYAEEIVFPNNECSEVILEADVATDFSAVVEDYTSRYSLEYYGIDKIYKGYWLYNYYGTVRIDLGDVFSEETDISIWVIKGSFLTPGKSELEACGFSTDGDIVTLDYDFESSGKYFIYVTEKKSAVSVKMSGITKKGTDIQLTSSSASQGVAFEYSFPLFQQSSGTTGQIYYTELEDDETTSSFLNRAIEFGNKKLFAAEMSEDDTDRLSVKNRYFIENMAEMCRKFFPFFEYDESEWENVTELGDVNFWCLFFVYYLYEDNGDIEEVTENTHTAFDIYTDELPFQNFESEYAPGGSCAGISHLTSYLFNTGSIPATGSYDGISWDISSDSENGTLMDLGLDDYKTASFVDDNSGSSDNYIGDGLSDGEQEFVKMIAAFWSESNDTVSLNDYMLSNSDKELPDWSIVEQMMSYLDEGKIVCLGLLLGNGSGHEVNVYDYCYTEDGEILFSVYDSNFPQDSREGFTLNSDGCYLECKKVTREDGTEAFSYQYSPVDGLDWYIASSDAEDMDISAFVATDENWNVFQ